MLSDEREMREKRSRDGLKGERDGKERGRG
jgi:hypothetical protein